MNENEKFTHSSDSDSNKDKEKFSIDSILAEYGKPKAKSTEASGEKHSSTLGALLGNDPEIRALFSELSVDGGAMSTIASKNTTDEGNTVVFDVPQKSIESDKTAIVPDSDSVKELFDVIDSISEEDASEDNDVKVYGEIAEDGEEAVESSADQIDTEDSEPEEILAAGMPLPNSEEATSGVNMDELFDGNADPLFAPNDIGFDSFEGTASEKASGGVVPEAEAFNSAKNGESSSDDKLKTLFGSTTGSNPTVGGKAEKKKKSPHSTASEILHKDEVDFSSEKAINRSLGFLFKKSRLALLSVIGTAIFLALSLLFTLSASFFPMSEYLKPGTYSTVFILVDLQILFFAAMCALDKLIEGAVDFYDGFGSPECVSLVITLLITAYSVFGAITQSGKEDVYVFGAVGCLCLFLVSLYDYYKTTSDYLSFRIAASPATKYGSVELDTNGRDCANFLPYMTAGSKAFTIQKGEKYINFTQRNEAVPKCESRFGVNCAISFAISLLVGTAVYFLGGRNLYIALTAALVVTCSSVSFTTFLAAALPRFILSKKASKHNCAIVGQNVYEEYENVSVISFEDTEVFLPKDVRVSSIRTYGKTPLDSAIMDIAFISKKLGGPLSNVFAKAVTYKPTDLDNVEILEVYPDALKAAIGENEYILATSAFLRANNYACYEDTVDGSYIASLGSIMYMVKNGETAAKFYIKYALNPQFENILSGLNDADICVSVRTVDPCINNDLLLSNLRGTTYRISVVKGKGVDSLPSTAKSVNSGIISITGIHNFLKLFILCDRLGRTVKVNSIVKGMGTAFGFAIPIVLFALGFANPIGAVNVINSLFVLLIQLFWLIPIAVISRLYK